MGSWKVTVRNGPKVERDRFDDLGAAIDRAGDAVRQSLSAGRLGSVKMLREFEPGQRVKTRIEINGPGLLRGAAGGLDVMGDDAVVAYAGSVRKRELAGETLDDALERLRAELGG